MNSSEMVQESSTTPVGTGAATATAAAQQVTLAVPAPVVALPRPGGVVEDRFRLVACRLEASLDRRGVRSGRVVVVTSAQRGDGKTTIALHLATALSRDLGRRVAVIDACLDEPGVATMLGLLPARGLGDVLAGGTGLEEIMLRGEAGGPYLVPAEGGGSGQAGVRGLVAAVEALRRAHGYDYLIVDTPALDTSAEAAVLGRMADGVVMVVRAGATRRDALGSALDALVDAPLVGSVLNDHDGPSGSYAASRNLTRLHAPPYAVEDD
jgi:Mrp family chromosome partitioning ATPase